MVTNRTKWGLNIILKVKGWVKMGRDIRVSFKMTEERKDDLQDFADSYGVTMSALCALIIGQWLHQQKNVVNPMVRTMMDAMEKQMQNVDTESMYELMQRMKKEQDRA